jgi:hypothetical protein
VSPLDVPSPTIDKRFQLYHKFLFKDVLE